MIKWVQDPLWERYTTITQFEVDLLNEIAEHVPDNQHSREHVANLYDLAQVLRQRIQTTA